MVEEGAAQAVAGSAAGEAALRTLDGGVATSFAEGADLRSIVMFRRATQRWGLAEDHAAAADAAMGDGRQGEAAARASMACDSMIGAARSILAAGDDASLAELDAETASLRPGLVTLRRGSDPSSQYSAAIWSRTWPLLFFCGDATNGLQRDVELADRRWSQCLLLRDDARWRRSRGFIAMAASVLKRRALIRACSALLRAPYYKGWSE